jgi:EmrB/QacA subfamily drug resistance transporter
MSDEPSPAKLTDEFSSKASDSRTESRMSHAHHRRSLRQHLTDLHGHSKNHNHRHHDSEAHGHSNGSGREVRHDTAAAAEATPAHGTHARPGTGKLLLLVCVAQLMVIVDITAVNVALPQLATGLHIDSSDIGWTVTSYSLIFGSLLLLGGRAADLIGRRRMFLTGLGVFTAASVASALAPSATALFAARAGQGLGAAMLSPAALSIIMATFTEGHHRARALGAWGAVGGAGAAFGVLLGGALTSLIGWQAIFLINVPVALALAVTTTKIVPADAARPQWRGLDLRGAVLATGSLAALVFALSQATSAGWTSLQTLGIGAAGILGLVTFALVEMRTGQPLLLIQRLADRGVGGGFVMMLAASAVLFGTFLLSSLYMQNVLGAGAMETGLAFLPLAIAIAAGVHAGSHAVTHAGVRVPMAFGFAVTAAGMLLLSGVGVGGSYLADVLPGMIIAGLGLGLILVSVSVSVMTGASEQHTGMLSGLNTTGHEIGGTIGIAILVTVAMGVGSGATSSATTLASGISDAFLAAGAIAGAASLIALLILPAAASFLPKLRLAPRVAIH